MNNKENLKILLTDDDPDDRELFKEAISELHLKHPVEYCVNGLELLERLKGVGENPDLIFLDLNMPMLSGVETLEEIRKDPRFKNIPIIAIYSTSSSEEDQKKTFLSGANAYVTKPVCFTQLKLLLEKVIETDWSKQIADSKMETFVISISK